MKKTYLLFLLTFALPNARILAQKSAATDKDLLSILGDFKMLDTFSYTTELKTYLSNDPKKVETLRTQYFQQKGNQAVIYTKSDKETFFFNQSGQFKVNHHDKTIKYHLFESDSIFKEYLNTYAVYDNSKIDSFFLKNALIQSKKIKGTKTSFQLKYENQSPIKEMTIIYQNGLKHPDTLSYLSEQPFWGSDDPTHPIYVRQLVTAYEYQKKIPDEVLRILNHAKDLLHFIQSEYKDYTIKAI
jgi:hypothetical protein